MFTLLVVLKYISVEGLFPSTSVANAFFFFLLAKIGFIFAGVSTLMRA